MSQSLKLAGAVTLLAVALGAVAYWRFLPSRNVNLNSVDDTPQISEPSKSQVDSERLPTLDPAAQSAEFLKNSSDLTSIQDVIQDTLPHESLLLPVTTVNQEVIHEYFKTFYDDDLKKLISSELQENLEAVVAQDLIWDTEGSVESYVFHLRQITHLMDGKELPADFKPDESYLKQIRSMGEMHSVERIGLGNQPLSVIKKKLIDVMPIWKTEQSDFIQAHLNDEFVFVTVPWIRKTIESSGTPTYHGVVSTYMLWNGTPKFKPTFVQVTSTRRRIETPAVDVPRFLQSGLIEDLRR
jgi:hypothetical protein